MEGRAPPSAFMPRPLRETPRDTTERPRYGDYVIELKNKIIFIIFTTKLTLCSCKCYLIKKKLNTFFKKNQTFDMWKRNREREVVKISQTTMNALVWHLCDVETAQMKTSHAVLAV